MRKVVLSWSGGKDSMMALKRLKANPENEVTGLMTAFSGEAEVVNLHHIPKGLIQKQADALGLNLYPIHLSEKPKNEEYEAKHQGLFQQLKAENIYDIAFGDIHLEPIREYRDRLLKASDMEGHYPLWQTDPSDLAKEFLSSGYEALITSLDTLQLPDSWLNQNLSFDFLEHFQESNIDPCGENGEYHTFVWNGPDFKQPVNYEVLGTSEMDFRPEIDMKLKVNQIS